MPEVKEIIFDDDTFTDFKPRAEEIARGLGKLGVTWSCNAKANVPYETLKVMKDNGLRLLLVGYESGNDQILHNIRRACAPTSPGASPRIAASSASSFTARSSWACPARRRRPSRETIQFADGDQSAHHPGLPGGALSGHGAVRPGRCERLAHGHPEREPREQAGRAAVAAELSEPRCRERSSPPWRPSTGASISGPRKIMEITAEMMRSWEMTKRRLREGVEFFRFLNARAA